VVARPCHPSTTVSLFGIRRRRRFRPLTPALGATTEEVARLQPDGTWLEINDNAWGDPGHP